MRIIYNHSPKYVIENINLCVFPLKEKTVVIMFISKEHKKYKLFIQQFKKLKEEEKLNLITQIEIEMKEAAKNLEFERATELRDILFELKGKS